MVPEGWKLAKLGDLVDISSGVAPSELVLSDSIGIPYVKVEDMNNCSKYQLRARQLGVGCKVAVKQRAVIFPKRGAAIINNKVRVAGRDIYLDTNMMALSPKNKLDAEFLYYSLIYIQLFKVADTSTIPQINNKHIVPLKILLPPLSEQKKIAETLSTWDKSIEAAERFLDNSKKRKMALMQQLLTGKTRLHGFDTRWKYQPISTITTRVQRKAKDRDDIDLPVLTISSSTGFVLQSDKYSKYMAGESVKNYTRLKKGEFSYNKGSSKAYVFGCIFELVNWEEALVPNVYVSFKFCDDIDRGFFRHLFSMGYLDRQLGRLVNSGVRNDGLLNITPSEFLKVSVPVPPQDEQLAISGILDAASYEIKLFQRRLDFLKQEKKALMQQLLTGKKRVKVDEAA